jgi:hypothetical protein
MLPTRSRLRLLSRLAAGLRRLGGPQAGFAQRVSAASPQYIGVGQIHPKSHIILVQAFYENLGVNLKLIATETLSMDLLS